jgi:hypothetical protein
VRIPRLRRALVALACALAAAGCGGGGTKHGAPPSRTVTVPAYAGFPAATIVGTYSASACTSAARAYLRDARLVVAHSGAQAAYSADNYYLELVQADAEFRAHSCEPATLGHTLETGMTARQRAALIADLPATMAQAVRSALATQTP